MTTVELWDCGDALGLIVPATTGIKYSNQTGGTACDHPEVEGFYVPLPSGWHTKPEVMQDVDGRWEDPEHILFINNSTASETDPSRIARLVQQWLDANYPLSEFFEVDPEKLTKTQEAWIWLRVKDCKKAAIGAPIQLAGLVGHSVVITYANSD